MAAMGAELPLSLHGASQANSVIKQALDPSATFSTRSSPLSLSVLPHRREAPPPSRNCRPSSLARPGKSMARPLRARACLANASRTPERTRTAHAGRNTITAPLCLLRQAAALIPNTRSHCQLAQALRHDFGSTVRPAPASFEQRRPRCDQLRRAPRPCSVSAASPLSSFRRRLCPSFPSLCYKGPSQNGVHTVRWEETVTPTPWTHTSAGQLLPPSLSSISVNLAHVDTKKRSEWSTAQEHPVHSIVPAG